jgi:hypothetical protein
MNVRYRVELSQAERDQLSEMLSGGKHAARKLKRAQILLAAASGVSETVIGERQGRGVYRLPDFAECMRDLVDIHRPEADVIRVVMDNLSTHGPGSLYEAFPAPEAHRILQRLEIHYTPKHASWLNMVELEIGVLRGQCLDRRIGDRKKLISEIAAWVKQRNKAKARIKWMFNTEKARSKLARAYPQPAKES